MTESDLPAPCCAVAVESRALVVRGAATLDGPHGGRVGMLQGNAGWGFRGVGGSSVFAGLSGAYDARLRQLAGCVAAGMDLTLKSGIFIAPHEDGRDRWPHVNGDGGNDYVLCDVEIMMAICAAAAQIPVLAVAIDVQHREEDKKRLFSFIERFIQCCGSQALKEIS